MGYHDLASYEEMLKKQTAIELPLSVDSFNYKTDRTLTLGLNKDGSRLHVFIKDQVLVAHEYFENPGSYTTSSWCTNRITPNKLVPSYGAIPIVTDTEFSELLFERHVDLRFVDWYSELNLAYETPEGFFGHIHNTSGTRSNSIRVPNS